MIGRADIEGSKSNVALNAWPPQASYPWGDYIETSRMMSATTEQDTMDVDQQSAAVPPPTKVTLEAEDGHLVLRWLKPEKFEYPCLYEVCVYQSKGRNGNELLWTDNTETTYYTFPKEKYSPIKSYFAKVSTMLKTGPGKSVPAKSSRRKLCVSTKDNRFFYDPSHPLKTGYEVYLGYIKSTEDKVAVKLIGSLRFKEIDHLLKFSKNPMENIVAYRDRDRTKPNYGKLCLAMELCDKDTLADIMKNNLLKGNEHEMKKVMIHIIRGLSCIHEKNILHRDLKPHNILRSLDGKTMKISDFGLSKQMEDGQSMDQKSQSNCGTEGWGSPEHYGSKGQVMSKKSDIFSTGLIYYYILNDGRCIYGDEKYEFIAKITRGEQILIPQPPCDEPELAVDLISKMLSLKQDVRLDCKQVLAHPFFWSSKRKIDFIHELCSYFKRNLHERESASSTVKEIAMELDKVDENFYDWSDKILESGNAGAEFLANEKAKKGKYNTASLKELVRFIRNIEEHYTAYEELVNVFKDSRANVWLYFSSIFPDILPKLFNIFEKHLSGMEEVPELTDIKKFLTKEAPYEQLEPFEGIPSKKRKFE